MESGGQALRMFSRRLAPHTDTPRTNSRNLGDRDHFRVRAMKVLFLLGLVACAQAGWGGKGKKEEKDRDEKEHMEESMYEEEVRAAGGRDYEVEGLKRRKAGEINDAELGINNLAGAMKDPAAMAEMAQMMRDPEAMRAVKEMMADPQFQEQAKAAMAQMQASGRLPDMAHVQEMMKDPAVMQKAKAMAEAMNFGWDGVSHGGGMGGGVEAELARLRAENARLKQQML
jgi:hypothetical protein